MAEETTEPPEPPPEPEFLDGDLALSRIQALVGNARTVWLGLIGFLAFIGLTLFSVRDVDFFSVSATTQLPIVNVSIPTTTFFWTAALLAALLHTYFHVFLLKLWDALAEAPPEIGKSKLGDRTFPWLVNDWALRRRADRPITKRPMDLLGNLVTALVIWLAAPLVLVGFWWRSLPAHDARLSLTIAGALLLALFASLRGWRRARTRLARPGLLQPAPERRRLRPMARLTSAGRGLGIGLLWVAMLAAVPAFAIATLAGAGGHHLPRGAEATLQTYFPEAWQGAAEVLEEQGWPLSSSIPMVRANLIDAEIAIEPDDWRDSEIARRRFHVDWCRDNGVPVAACEKPASRETNIARAEHCREHGVAFADCPAHFAGIDEAFADEWNIEREASIDNIRGPDLRGRDVRNAAASGAFLAGVDLREARLEGASLFGARLEGADLGGARLEGANLFGARLEGAYLREAGLEGADLTGAGLEGADLRRAGLEGASLFGARLEGAYLRRAGLEGADLRRAGLKGADLGEAGLEGANLSGARLEGAYLFGAGLEGADLRWAGLEGANLYEAWLKGADLRWAGLEGASLFGAWLEGANLSEARLEGTNLSYAGFQSAEWAGASFAASPAHSADFTAGKNLTQTQLAQVIGDDDTILPRDGKAGEQLYVWSCWEKALPNLEELFEMTPWEDPDDLRAEWLCAEGEAPRKVGTPAEEVVEDSE